MITKIRYGSEEEYSQLLLASKNEKKVKQKKRYDTVLLHMEGYSRKQIAEILHIPHRTVCAHIASYRKGGMDALLLFKQTGAPKKLSEEQEHTLVHIISTQHWKKQVWEFLPTGHPLWPANLQKRDLVWHSAIGECATSLTVSA